jgi:hypothetical protein
MDRNKKWKKSFRCLALVLVFAMLCSMGVLAAKTSNETEETYTTTISSIWTQNTFMNTASLTIDAYATSKTNEQKTVVPVTLCLYWISPDGSMVTMVQSEQKLLML